MRKFFVILFSVLAVSLGTVSCNDNVTDSSDGTEKPDTANIADYTVIFWGMGGANDVYAIGDLSTMADHFLKGVTGKNVNVAGIYKTSMSLWGKKTGERVSRDMDKTYYFDSRIKADSIPQKYVHYLKPNTVEQMDSMYQTVFSALNGKVVGDYQYRLDSKDSLANFIKQVADTFPARHYVLLLWGHGNGFIPDWDYVSPETAQSRACVYDELTLESALAADNIVYAVQQSGVKMQTIFTQCCQMAALENMAAYSKCFDYGVLSAENTGSFYFPEYITKLSEAGNDEAKMQQKTKELVDFYVLKNSLMCSSQGFYDLRKMSQLLPVVKEATNWYVNNYTDSVSKSQINRALGHAVFYAGLNNAVDQQRRKLVQKYLWEGVDALTGDKKTALTEVFTAMSALVNDYGARNQNGFCMADVLAQTLKAKISQEKIAQLQSIYSRYMTILKDMAYIKTAEKPEKATADYEYVYASPTVNLFALNSDYYFELLYGDQSENIEKLVNAILAGDNATAKDLYHQMFEGTLMENTEVDRMKKFYQGSVFDQQVGWSNFLEKLEFNPSIIINPDREQINEEME